MGFFDWLGSLFGGGQKPAAPAPAPAPLVAKWPAATPAKPAAPAAFPPPVQQQQQGSFGGGTSGSFAPGPAAQPQQQNNSGPWRTLNFAPPAQTAKPLDLQKPQLEEPMFQRGEKAAEKIVADKKQASKQNNYFGGVGDVKTEQMSVDAYLQLSPQQRASVDANTALVQAAEEDKASWAKQNIAGKPIDDQKYLSQVKGKFGDSGGSDVYAPRTMAVLEDLGLNLQGKDLDQYLNHSALVTSSDLNLIGSGSTAIPGLRAEDPRQANAAEFARAATSRLSKTLAMGQNLLDSIRTSSDANRQLFGTPATTAPPVGYAETARDKDLAQAFDVFAQTRSQQDLTPETVGGVYAELEQKYGVTPNEVAQYFDTKLQSKEYLGALGDQQVSLGGPGMSGEYLSPADFRSKFLTRGQ